VTIPALPNRLYTADTEIPQRKRAIEEHLEKRSGKRHVEAQAHTEFKYSWRKMEAAQGNTP